MDYAEEITGTLTVPASSVLEAKKQASAKLQEKYKAVQEREKALEESLKSLRENLFCELCGKQYYKFQAFENHLNSYDHAHKQRLKDLKQRDRTVSKWTEGDRNKAKKTKQLHKEKKAKQLHKEKEAKQLHKEKEAKELHQEKEAKQLHKEKEAKELRKEQEAKELYKEKEAKQLHKEKEAKELHMEKEAKQLHKEKEAKELHMEKEAKELHKEMEAKQLHEEKEAKELHKEKEAKQLHKEKEAKELHNLDERRAQVAEMRITDTVPEIDMEVYPNIVEESSTAMSHQEALSFVEHGMLNIIKTDPLLQYLPPGVTLDELNSMLALEHGRAMTVIIHRADKQSYSVVVEQKATVMDLKKAIQRHVALKLKRDGCERTLSWRYIWKTYWLYHESEKLTQDNKPLKDYGIKNNSELTFLKRLRNTN